MTYSVILAVDYLTSNHDSSPMCESCDTKSSPLPAAANSMKSISQTQVSGQAPLQAPAENEDLCPLEHLAVEVPMGYNGLPHPIYPSAVDASIAPGVLLMSDIPMLVSVVASD
uniref:Uncharacterized protein n=1 Tax=Coccidioides posadasii RMSCC 3488 TaxID=454284 RepID=A0A0J6IIL8_COCPO|nr:hypothetical protein CPAG_08005 [Coccidioides posadasii RMSCC 3488]